MKVAVVGGGVVGLCAAHYLQRAGVTVTVVDRGAAGGECSAGNAGWICPSISFPLPAPGLTATSLRWLLASDSPLHINPAAVPALLPWLLQFRRFCTQGAFTRGTRALTSLAADTLRLYDDMAASGIEFEHHRQGLLMLFESPAGIDAELTLLRLSGYERSVRTINAADLPDLEPALETGLAGGLLVVPEWHVRPESLCRGLAAALETGGAEIITGVPVDAVRSQAGRAVAVETAAGSIEADAFLVCAGAETGRLTAKLGYPLPLQAGKGYSITVHHPKVHVDRPLYFVDTKLALTPFANAVRVAGTMELAGINLSINPKRVAALERVAERSVPGILNGERTAPWVGMRPLTPDGLPVLGRIATRDNVFVASGHQMLGMTLAPATGRAMADWIATNDAPRGLAPFDPSRFH